MNLRWTRVAVAVISSTFLLTLGACGGVAEQPEDAPIRVNVAPTFISVENQTGAALSDIEVKIIPYGAATEFRVMVYRMGNAEKRDFMLGDFRGKDGTPFNARVVRVKSVVVLGKNMDDEVVQVEVPWP
jgi:hypothetical protein